MNTSNSQKVNLDLLKNMKPRNIGPAGMSGRVTAIDVVLSNPDEIYVGTASGGVWKTENGGTTWSPIFDDQPILNIGSLAIQQSNPSVIWAGTGEGNPRNSVSIGEGIYKSIDGGKSWRLMGLKKTRNIHRVIIDPTNPNIVYAGAIGNPYSEHSDRGVFKTIDGGETWTRMLYTNDTSGVADMIMDPKNPNKLIVAMWQHRRTPYSFKSGGIGSGLYITYDGGKTWKKEGKEDGLPAGELGRIGIAIAPSEPSRVYAMVEATKNGLYKSDDGGIKWSLVNSDPNFVTTRSFYFQGIRVDSKNENRLYSLYQPIAVSEDAGRSFKIIAPLDSLHADHHAIWIHPENPSFIIEGGDGGLSISHDRGRTWRPVEQLPVGQFYHINADNELPYNVMGGLQDNGSWRGPAYKWQNGSLMNSDWVLLSGGDGFDATPDPEDANWVYSMAQHGSLSKYNVSTGDGSYIEPPAPDLNTRLRFNWNAGLAIDPFDPKTIYYGSQFVHKSPNKGLTWEVISPDLTTNNKEQQKQDENGGLSIDITGAENYNTILCISPSPKKKGVIWAGTDDGNVQLTIDAGKTWTNLRSKIPGLPVGAWIPQIKVSSYNEGEAVVVANDYRRGDFKPYIFRTKDFGKTWTRLVDETKVTGYALCYLQDPVEPNLVFAGTEQGLWISFDNANTFQQWKNGYPSVSTYDLAIQEREADLVIATFGRSLYVLDDIRPLRKIASGYNISQKPVTVFAAPVAYMANYKNQQGQYNNGYGMFEGRNRPTGASYTFYVPKGVGKKIDSLKAKPPMKSTASHEEDVMTVGDTTTKMGNTDSAIVKIYNDQNILIRTLHVKADSGLNRNYWGFETKGVRPPEQRRGRGRRFQEPAGFQVFPGTYKLIVEANNASDSTMISVMSDPRVPQTREQYDAKVKLLNQLDVYTEKLTAVNDNLTDAEETIKKVNSALPEGKDGENITKMGKAMSDSIKNIRDFMLGKKQEKQGYGTPYQLTAYGKVQEAKQSITGKNKTPDQQEERLTSEAAQLTAEVVARANNFFNGAWKNYQSKVENSPIKLFKPFKTL
ncbi:MAG: hypothetical protein NVS3B19_01810 [Ginsengibacter sp.]